MNRRAGGILVLVLGMSVALAGDERQDKAATPAEQYQALLEERRKVPEDLSKAKTDEERKKALARLAKLPLRFLALAEANPKAPVALKALIETVSLVNGTASPAGGKDSPGRKALEIFLRDDVRGDKLRRGCGQVVFGFVMSDVTFLRAGLGKSAHREVQALARLSVAQFRSDRLHRLDVLKAQDGPDLAERYRRV